MFAQQTTFQSGEVASESTLHLNSRQVSPNLKPLMPNGLASRTLASPDPFEAALPRSWALCPSLIEFIEPRPFAPTQFVGLL
jgi:hypothetical protein